MIQINKDKWNIMFVPFNHNILQRSNNTLSFATCDTSTKTIYINNDLRGKFLKKVLYHEITHAVIFSYNVELTVNQEELFANLFSIYGDEITYITNTIFNTMQKKLPI